MRCPSCSKELAEDSRFCSGCGSSIQAAAAGSLSQAPTAAIPSPAPARARISTPQARFVPGTVLAERYRIVAQVGRGGMGEVYRADDLRLGQTVALKFLPVLRGKNPEDLAQLHREVRIARQISHPNVCRVFDVGDADGVPFITMEFVDGEDLASLMKRIGRLQPDKATQLAQQLCAGLAEAHSFGVLHRDLKPANIMLDGRGNARITDFGLAIMAGEARGEDAWAGTPAYMAPEQLAGSKPTTQTDIYALGLVLYELFTGKEAFSGASLAEILQQRQKGAPAKISGIVKGLDPAIERVILQCLEKDPRSRPRTAQQIAAALPGGDPLSAAIAAGETPSPEMVAAAKDQPLMSAGRLWLLCAAVAVGIVAVGYMMRDGTLLGLAPLEYSPQAMTYRARQLLSDLGYTMAPADSDGWYEVDVGYVQRRAGAAAARGQYRQTWSARPGPWRFIYRQSPRLVAKLNPITPVTRLDPPDLIHGMITVALDAGGNILQFSVVPEEIPDNSAKAAPDWMPLLSNAGLTEIEPAEPRTRPMFSFDSLSGWNAKIGDKDVHIVSASNQGKPTYFSVVENSEVSETSQVGQTGWPLLLIITMSVSVVCFILARRNMKLGRIDQKGATRVAALIFACILVRRTLNVHYVPDSAYMFDTFVYGVGFALFFAVMWVFLSYIALEPYVRRRWPGMLVSWNRVLSGRFSDARVGADTLAGCACGVVMVILGHLSHVLPVWLNLLRPAPFFDYYAMGEISPLRGLPGILSNAIRSFTLGVALALMTVAILLIARICLRRNWMAVILLGLICMMYFLGMTGSGFSSISVPAAGLAAAASIFILYRFGILGLAAALFTHRLVWACVLTLDFSRWYVWSSVVALAILAVLVIHGFRAALAERPLFGRAILED